MQIFICIHQIIKTTETTKMFSREVIEQLNAPALKELCRAYKLIMSGNKTELFERLIAHQEKLKQESDNWSRRMAYGATKRDKGFERVISVFNQWSDKNGFWPSKLSRSGISYEFVDINEIRAAFADYDPDTSPLREDKYSPSPGTKLEVFLEMLFNDHDEWEFFDHTNADREFDCDSEFSARWMITGMKEIYDET